MVPEVLFFGEGVAHVVEGCDGQVDLTEGEVLDEAAGLQHSLAVPEVRSVVLVVVGAYYAPLVFCELEERA